MVNVEYDYAFKKAFLKIKDRRLKIQVCKQISKLKSNPMAGKPMRFARKGTRELYVKPFRISYRYFEQEDTVWLLDIYHKDSQ